MTPEEIKMVNATSRYTGAVGARALVPRVVEEMLSSATRATRVLDYGAGKKAAHATRFNEQFPHDRVWAHEIGGNFVEGVHDKDALEHEGRYDIVYSSNVLNVLPHQGHVLSMLEEVKRVLRLGGIFVCNYPTSPRKSDIGVERMEFLISWVLGGRPERVAGTKQAPVWVVECLNKP